MKTENKYCKVGDRVVRGPGWMWGDQDCDEYGIQNQGTITRADSPCTGEDWWWVRWDHGGNERNYGITGLTVLPTKLNELTIPTQWGMRRVFCGCNDPAPPSAYETLPNIPSYEEPAYANDYCDECRNFAWVYKNKNDGPKS